MSQFKSLVNTALLGTARTTHPSVPDDQSVAHLLAGQNREDAESKLLNLAAIIGLQEQAGQLPARLPQVPAFNPFEEELPACTSAAGQHLLTMLDGKFLNLLPEFLAALASNQHRVAGEYLPGLLNHGLRIATIRHQIIPVLGLTGRELAARNPDWSYAAPTVDTWEGVINIWQRSNDIMRARLLRQLRHMHPQLGLQALASTWKTAGPGAPRLNMIKVLRTGLSIHDEPFLETALDDRETRIRREAANLLTRLPESRLANRMLAHMAGILHWTSGEAAIDVTVPRVITPALERDGVRPRQGLSLARIRSSQLVEMLGAVPLSHWTDTWQALPEEIVEAAQNSKWPRTLIKGFVQAAERQSNPQWAHALLISEQYHALTMRLVPILEPLNVETIVRAMVNERPATTNQSALIRILRKWPHPWTLAAYSFVLEYLTWYMHHDTDDKILNTNIRMTIQQLAQFCPPSVADLAARTLSTAAADTIWQTTAMSAVSILNFRQRMLAAISAG